MLLSPKESIEQLEYELNDTKGRLDALSFMARIILDSLKIQDKEAYQALKESCLHYAQEHLVCLGDIGEDDIEEQAQAFAEEIENLFCDDKEDLFEQE